MNPHDSISTAPLSTSDNAESDRHSRVLHERGKQFNLAAIAKWHRLLLRGVALLLLGLVLIVATWMLAPNFLLVAYSICAAIAVGVVVVVGRLAVLCGHSPAAVVVTCICMIIPFVALVMILSINGTAISLLRRTGVRVGLLGVPEPEMVKLYKGWCSRCGYYLHGLRIDRCPERGMMIHGEPDDVVHGQPSPVPNETRAT